MSTTESGSEQRLVRAIGVRGLTASIVNTTIGAGIFVLPALVARDLGSAAPLAYLACGLAMTFVVASFAMAGSRVSLTGGIYAYVEVAFGPLIGFLTGFLVWLSCLLAAASVASALAASVALAVPVFSVPILRVLGLGLVFATFAWVNVRGVAMGTRLVEVITVTKLLPLLLLTAVGLFWVRPEHLALEWAAPDRIGTASITLIFAFMGIEIALAPSGEIREPARTVPRAVFLALGRDDVALPAAAARRSCRPGTSARLVRRRAAGGGRVPRAGAGGQDRDAGRRQHLDAWVPER